jgi:hypothetical protein
MYKGHYSPRKHVAKPLGITHFLVICNKITIVVCDVP